MERPLLSRTASSAPAAHGLATLGDMEHRARQELSQQCFSESLLFTSVVTAIVVANTAVIALESIYIQDQMVLFDRLELTFAILYTLEIGWRIRERGTQTFMCQDDWCWGWFYLLIVILSVMDIVLSAVARSSPEASTGRLFRILRVLRIFRALRLIKEANHTIIRVVSAALKLLLAMILMLFVAAVIATQMLWDCSDPSVADMFQNLGQSMWSMGKLMTIDDWAEVSEQVANVKPGMLVFFMAFIFMTSTVFVSLVPVVFLESSLKSRSTRGNINGACQTWDVLGSRLHELSSIVREELSEIRRCTGRLEKDIAQMINSAKMDRSTGGEMRGKETNTSVASAGWSQPCPQHIQKSALNPQQVTVAQAQSTPSSPSCVHRDSPSERTTAILPTPSGQHIQECDQRGKRLAAEFEDTELPNSRLFARYLQGDTDELTASEPGVQRGKCTPRSQVSLAADRKLMAYEDPSCHRISGSVKSPLTDVGQIQRFDTSKGIASQGYAYIPDYPSQAVTVEGLRRLESDLTQCEAVPRERSANRDSPKLWPLVLPYKKRGLVQPTGQRRASPAASDSSKDPPSPIPMDSPSADMFQPTDDVEHKLLV